jgi:hypothetical protein
MAVFVIVGLMTAPLAKPVVEHSMSAIFEETCVDMPCCPDQDQEMPAACQHCPFMACVFSMSLPERAGAHSLPIRLPLRVELVSRNDLLIDGLSGQPPDHPPRYSI